MSEKQNAVLLMLFILLFGLFVFGLIFYQQQGGQDSFGAQPQSSLVLSPTGKPPLPPEPKVFSWRTYTNDTFNFTIDVPEGWREQDYVGSYKDGGTLVAFSPDPLPCPTCSYFHNGFFSVRVYSQRSDPVYYADFANRVKSLGKKPGYQGVALDKAQGVAFANTIAVEKNGWVYELSLDRGEGQANIMDSEIFQKAATSFRLTHIVFNE